MVSVGVDVDRLGLMVVFAQPKQTAEYIQATSRVGRKHPGLIVTVYKSGFARDRAHYESFRAWNQALYRDVEPSSVTPFAARCRERVLPAVVAVLAMKEYPGLRRDAQLDEACRRDIESTILPRVERRVGAIDPPEVGGLIEEVRWFLDAWRVRSDAASPRALAVKNDSEPARALFVTAEKIAELRATDGSTAGLVAAPNSMRDVEPSSPVKLLEFRETSYTRESGDGNAT